MAVSSPCLNALTPRWPQSQRYFRLALSPAVNKRVTAGSGLFFERTSCVLKQDNETGHG